MLGVHQKGQQDTRPAMDASGSVSIEMKFERGSYRVVDVEGPPEGDYAAVRQGFTPLAFSNPIFIDADEDGQWSAPGLTQH